MQFILYCHFPNSKWNAQDKNFANEKVENRLCKNVANGKEDSVTKSTRSARLNSNHD